MSDERLSRRYHAAISASDNSTHPTIRSGLGRIASGCWACRPTGSSRSARPATRISSRPSRPGRSPPRPARRCFQLGVRPPFALNVGGQDDRRTSGAYPRLRGVPAAPRVAPVGCRLPLTRPTTPRPSAIMPMPLGRRRISPAAGPGLRRVAAAALPGLRAVVFPSLYEGFGLPILEAMHCGMPVIVGWNSSQAGGRGGGGADLRRVRPLAADAAAGRARPAVPG